MRYVRTFLLLCVLGFGGGAVLIAPIVPLSFWLGPVAVFVYFGVMLVVSVGFLTALLEGGYPCRISSGS